MIVSARSFLHAALPILYASNGDFDFDSNSNSNTLYAHHLQQLPLRIL